MASYEHLGQPQGAKAGRTGPVVSFKTEVCLSRRSAARVGVTEALRGVFHGGSLLRLSCGRRGSEVSEVLQGVHGNNHRGGGRLSQRRARS